MKKRLIKTGLILFLGFIILSEAHADGLAGPNRKTCPDPQGMGMFSEPVKLGADNPPAGLCYFWMPDYHLSDRYSPNPIADPPTTTTYTLYTVTENFGTEKVYSVTVEVEQLQSFEVTPKCCYKPGQALSRSDFHIVTNPPGLEEVILFEPAQVSKSIVATGSQYTETITFTTPCNTQHQAVTITVADDRYTTGSGVSVPDINNFSWSQAMIKIEQAFQKFEDLVGKLPAQSCETSFETTFEGGYKQYEECCKNNCIVEGTKVEFGMKLCNKTSCDVPFYGVPYVLSLNIRLSTSWCLAPTVSFESRCQEQIKICITMPVEGSIGGGLSFTALGGKILDASGMVVGKVTPPTLKLCMWPEPKIEADGKLCAQVDANLELKLVSLVKVKHSVSIIPKTCKTIVPL